MQKLELRFRRSARQFCDCDYIDRLDDESREWLKNFLNAHYANGFKGEYKDEDHREYRKSRMDAYNAAQRDLWLKTLVDTDLTVPVAPTGLANSNSNGALTNSFVEMLLYADSPIDSLESALIASIDAGLSLEDVAEYIPPATKPTIH